MHSLATPSSRALIFSLVFVSLSLYSLQCIPRYLALKRSLVVCMLTVDWSLAAFATLKLSQAEREKKQVSNFRQAIYAILYACMRHVCVRNALLRRSNMYVWMHAHVCVYMHVSPTPAPPPSPSPLPPTCLPL